MNPPNRYWNTQHARMIQRIKIVSHNQRKPHYVFIAKYSLLKRRFDVESMGLCQL